MSQLAEGTIKQTKGLKSQLERGGIELSERMSQLNEGLTRVK
jgi:hypothetical protein